MSSKQRKVLRKGNLMKQEQFAQLQPQTIIPLPPRTRGIIEKKLSNKASLMALAKAEEQAINDLIEASREMLGVPDGWSIRNTDEGFTAPAGAAEPADVVVAPAVDMEPGALESVPD